MASLSGRSLGTGAALGTAAIVRMRNGLPIPPAIPPRVAAQLARRREDETPDVVLVAEDYGTAASFAASLKWGNVVGIIAGFAPPEVAAPLLPIVVDLPALLETVQDDMLVIVDGDRGVIIADPDAVVIGQYQAEHNHLAPKRRLYLDEGHLRAHTLDGRTVPVAARVSTFAEVDAALANGADALCVPFDCELLPAEAEEEEQRTALFALIEQTSGKPIYLSDEYTLPSGLILEVSTKADVAIGCPVRAHLEGLGVGELGLELNEARADCLANDTPCDMPQMVVEIPGGYNLPLDDPEKAAFFLDRFVYNGATRAVLMLEDDTLDTEMLSWVDGVVASANSVMLPVFAQWIITSFDFSGVGGLDASARDTLRLLVGSGVSGLIVTSGDVADVKAAVSELSFSECRESLSDLLAEYRNGAGESSGPGSSTGRNEYLVGEGIGA